MTEHDVPRDARVRGHDHQDLQRSAGERPAELTVRGYDDLYAEQLAARTATAEYARSVRAWRVRAAIAGLAAGALVGLRLDVSAAFSVAAALLGAGVGAIAGGWFGGWSARDAAASEARGRFFAAWAADRGLEYLPQVPKYTDTPTLTSGTRREFHDGFRGELAPDLHGCVFNVTIIEEVTSSDGDGGHDVDETEYEYTAVRLTLDSPLREFSITPGAGGDDGRSLLGQLYTAMTRRRVVTLESRDFHRRFRLEVHAQEDEVAARQLFDPTLVMAFVDSDERLPVVEARGSTLVFVQHGHFDCTDADALDELPALFEAIAPVARAIQRRCATMAA